ncbi:MAG: S8 family serine peptidase [Bryobacteraceae bacterium]
MDREPAVHPGEIVVELRPGAVDLSKTNLLGFSTEFLELLAMLRREHGLVRVEPYWPIGGHVLPKIGSVALRLLPRPLRELIRALTGAAGETPLDSTGFEELLEAARLRLKITFDPAAPVSEVLRALLGYAGVEFAEEIPVRWIPAFEPNSTAEMRAAFPKPPATHSREVVYPDPGPSGYWGRTVTAVPDEWDDYELDNIAVLDSGCDAKHTALTGRMNYLSSESALDRSGHGTFVSGILAARAVAATPYVDPRIVSKDDCDVQRGLLPKSRLTVMSIMKPETLYDEKGQPYFQVDPGRYSMALAKLVTLKNVRVLNLSIGGPKPVSKTEKKDLDALEKAGIVVVAAAGNGRTNADPVLYPALHSTVVSVGAVRYTEPQGTPWDKSRTAFPPGYTGDRKTAVDLWAPGDWILSTAPMDEGRRVIFSGWNSGTSMAAPFVTATAAVLAAKYPESSAAEIRGMLGQLRGEDGRLVCGEVML